MPHKIKIKVIPNNSQRWYTISGPEEWAEIPWDRIAIETAPNYTIRARLQMVFADLLNDYRAMQKRREAIRQAGDRPAKKGKDTDKSSWPIFEGLQSEIMADERTRNGEHVIYARPRSGQIGGGRRFNAFRCPCMEGQVCLKKG